MMMILSRSAAPARRALAVAAAPRAVPRPSFLPPSLPPHLTARRRFSQAATPAAAAPGSTSTTKSDEVVAREVEHVARLDRLRKDLRPAKIGRKYHDVAVVQVDVAAEGSEEQAADDIKQRLRAQNLPLTKLSLPAAPSSAGALLLGRDLRRAADGVRQGAPARLFGITLDGMRLRTPGRRALVFANHDFAARVAAEWDAQVEHVEPSSMPFTTIACTAIDQIASTDDGVRLAADRMLPYLETDTLVFMEPARRGAAISTADKDRPEDDESDAANAARLARVFATAELSEELRAQQRLEWEPLRDEFAKLTTAQLAKNGARVLRLRGVRAELLEDVADSMRLKTSDTLVKPAQDAELLQAAYASMVLSSPLYLACLEQVVSNATSFVCGVLLCEGRCSPDAIFEASNLEELKQRSTWGTVEGDHDVNDDTRRRWLSAAHHVCENWLRAG